MAFLLLQDIAQRPNKSTAMAAWSGSWGCRPGRW